MDQLPNEIFLQILQYLSTYELIQFCQATERYYFLEERKLVRALNISGNFEAYKLPVCKFLLNNVCYLCTKKLNISFLYWIKSIELNRLINRMTNLTELMAVNTNLKLNMLKPSIFMKLEKLAVSLNRGDVMWCPCSQNNLKFLYIQINEIPFDSTHVITFMGDLIDLEELWICNDERNGQSIDYSSLADILRNLKKLVIKTNILLSDFDLNHLGLRKIFDRKSMTSSVLIFERLEKPNVAQSTESRETEIGKHWDKIMDFHDFLPCGFKECRQLFFNPDINHIYFEDLNFADDPFECGLGNRDINWEEYNKAVLNLLCSKNASHLKRLAIRACSFLHLATLDRTPTLKRKRAADGRPLIYHKIGNNIRNLKVLEIVQCSECSGESDFLTHYMIDIFGTLEKVKIEIQMISSGLFLKEMFLKCPRLYSLNLICDDGCRSFINHLCQFLQYATSLRDFRLDYKADDISDILNALSSISSKKLLRILLKCKTVLDCYNELFTVFLQNNPQILFLYLVVSEDCISKITVLQETFDRLRNGNSTKVFLVKPNESHYFLDATAAHLDMLLNHTNVSVVNLEDF